MCVSNNSMSAKDYHDVIQQEDAQSISRKAQQQKKMPMK
jgi:hypothetical protein